MNIKKKLLAALLSMALVITMMPQAAFAADSSVTILIGGKTLDAVNCYYVNGESGNPGTVTGVEPAEGAWNAHYNSNADTLYLKNLTLTKNADGSDSYSNHCIDIHIGVDFTIDLTGTNTLSAGTVYTLRVSNDTTNGSNLTIGGTGSLTATQNDTTGGSAVYLKNIHLTMKNGSLTGITNAMEAWACGIKFDNGTLTVNSGSITGEANGVSTDGGRYGIGFGESVGGSVTINGGSLYAKSDSAGGLSANSLTMNGGTLLATSAENNQTLNLSMGLDLTDYKAYPTNATSDLGYVAVYSSAADGSTPTATESYNYSQSHKYLKIAPAVLTIAGKKMADGCYYTNGTEGVPGTVTATEPADWNAKLELVNDAYKLALNDLQLNYNDTSNGAYGIYSNDSINLALEGASRISAEQTQTGSAAGVYINDGNLTVTGSGSLTASGKSSNSEGTGIYIGNELAVSSGSLTGTGDGASGTGVFGGNISLSGTAKVIGKGLGGQANCLGVKAYNSIAISDSAYLEGCEDLSGVYDSRIGKHSGVHVENGGITISGGTLMAQTNNSYKGASALSLGNNTLNLPSNAAVKASTSSTGSPTVTYNSANLGTYKYISIEAITAPPSSSGFFVPVPDKDVTGAEDLIGAIGIVDLNKADEIQAARAAYDKLTDAQKRQVKNYQTLTEAEAALKALADQAAQEAEKEKATLKQRIKDMDLTARSRLITLKNGKKAVRIIWYEEKNGKLIKVNLDFDGVEIFRSENRYSGYGKTPIFTTTNGSYLNTAIEPNHTYYYKLRAYVLVDGKKVYTADSKKAMRTIK